MGEFYEYKYNRSRQYGKNACREIHGIGKSPG